jgi:hypothetical protein
MDTVSDMVGHQAGPATVDPVELSQLHDAAAGRAVPLC